MTTFAQAVTKTIDMSRTENGALTYSRSGSSHVDLFNLIGSGSKQPSFEKDLQVLFEKSYADNKELATRILLWSRDARGGAGRRKAFRNIMKYMETYHKDDLMQILPYVWNYGRWDDYLVFETAEVQKFAFDIIWSGLNQADKAGLVAKWMPRKGYTAKLLREHMGMTPKAYRKMLVSLTSVVEQKMCAKDWESINFEHVPSLASSRYSKAFAKNAPVSYAKYMSALKKGEAKINAGAIFPHDVVKNIMSGNVDTAREQWKALPNFMGDKRAIPMIDVSGSMLAPCDKGLMAIHVALSLGLYCADKNTGVFKDVTLTFSSSPVIDVLKGDIVQKMNQLQRQSWGMTTNIQAAFQAVLKLAVANKVPEDEMPEYMIILSDMEFNSCVQGGTNYDNIRKQYVAAGYKLPRIIFWNLMGRVGNSPVKFDVPNTAMVSGYSPALLKSIFDVENFTPENVMLKTVMSPRYNIFN
jgi:Domain of unknown function (DUF2828)